MKRAIQLWRVVVCIAAVLALSAGLWAQKTAVPSRVVETVDDTHTVTLKGNVYPSARAANDQGALPDSQPMTRMMLLLQRSAAQELELKKLMDAQQAKNSGSYHAWLTPEQFGEQFGPSDADVQAVTDWLTREGFQVASVGKGKTVIEFSGNAGQVRNAFHTEIHKFVVNGEEHFANVSDPAIPEALSPVVAGVAALHNFPKHPYIVKNGIYRRYKGSNQLQPLFTFGGSADYAVGPGDFAKIYGIPPGADGTGQAIAVVAQTNINTQDVTDFRHMFGLDQKYAANNVTVVVNGTDPGIVGPGVSNCYGTSTDDEIEADLDSEWSGAIAPGANIYLVVSQTTCSNPNQVSQGVDLSALYAVDKNLAGVITDSYGNCEANLLQAGNQFYNSLWEQAAAQGITVAVAAGDSGSAGCDPSSDPDAAALGVAVSGLASTPYNVAVGGTDFDPSTTGNQTYWNKTNDMVTSAVGYIPEITWDNSACALAFAASGSPCSSVDTSSYAADISAGSGGPSNCIDGVQNTSTGVITCRQVNNHYGYPKPPFQTTLTPPDSVRDIPDVSFYASNGGPISGGTGVAYVICQSDSNPQGSGTPTGASCNLSTPYTDFSLVGGTSAATPAFAAVMALVNQSTGQRQGNPNYVLYNLAAMDTNYMGGKCVTSTSNASSGTPLMPNPACVFNDVNKGNNAVACDAGTPNCSNNGSGSTSYGVLQCIATSNSITPAWQTCPPADNGDTVAFNSEAKYDLATGLGSINVGNLLTKWASASRMGTKTTLTSQTGGTPSGQTFTATVSVSPTPMGSNEAVSLIALASDGTTVLGSYGPFALASGSASVTTNLLPPGTANVEGSYGGDAALAASTSEAVPIGTVLGANQPPNTQASTITVYFVSLSSSGPSNPTQNKQNFPYGSQGYILQIAVTGSNGNCTFAYPNTKPAIPCPTGTISLFSNGNPLNDFTKNGKAMATDTTSLNNQGFAEDQPINVNAGTYSITATYSGDKNYAAASTAEPFSLTLTPVSTTTTVTTNPSSVTSGGSAMLTAIVGTNSGGIGPTGKVNFTDNGNSLGSATCVPTAANSSATAFCTATLTAAISSLYHPPPTGGPGTPAIPRVPLLVAVLSLLMFALGLRWIPETRRRAYTYAGLLAIALLVGVIAGCGGGGGNNNGTTRTIGATYSGDTNYTTSVGTTTIQIQ
jgi:hypothetical protein